MDKAASRIRLPSGDLFARKPLQIYAFPCKQQNVLYTDYQYNYTLCNPMK